MPIKNYTTKVPANQSIAQIQQILLKHGALGFMMKYEQGTGRIKALEFILPLQEGRQLPIRLPVDWHSFKEVLKKQGVPRWDEDDYCYRVAWRNIYDWVDVQCALYETKMVQMTQIFLPYAVTKKGSTVFEEMVQNPQLLLE